MNHYMNKQELLDKAVEQFDGKWPAYCDDNIYMSHRPEIENTRYYPFYVTDYKAEDYVCWHMSEFQQRAKELGYVNGYRYGVEYELDGKGPDLPDDTLIVWTDSVRSAETTCHRMNWVGVKSFRITDPRHKPADTSYLEKSIDGSKTLFNQTDSSEWSDYRKAQQAFSQLPKGCQEALYLKFEDWCDTECNKVMEAVKRKETVDAVSKVFKGYPVIMLLDMYDAGVLKMPSKTS